MRREWWPTSWRRRYSGRTAALLTHSGSSPHAIGRDRIVRDLAGGGSLRQQAEAIRQKVRRYRPHPSDRDTCGERGLLWQLQQMGSLDLSERQIRRILGGR